jgi:hypothetical protein
MPTVTVPFTWAFVTVQTIPVRTLNAPLMVPHSVSYPRDLATP